MISFTNILIFSFCIVISAYRSYRKGVWQALLSLFALLCAYIASFVLGPPLSSLLKPLGGSSTINFIVALTLVFTLVMFLVSVLPGLFFPRIKEVSQVQQVGGAVLGLITGTFLAIILIWVSTFVRSALEPELGMEKPDVLTQFSTGVISSAAETGMNVLDTDKRKAHVTSVLLSQPETVSATFSELSRSDDLQDLWLDGEFQFLMAEQDINAMMDHPKFKAITEKPAVKKLIELSRPVDVPEENTEHYLASKMSFLWRRMRTLRSDERVVAILEDPEFKALLEKQNPLALITSRKAQSLMDIVLEEAPNEANTTEINTSETPLPKPSKQVKKQESAVYKWQDAQGNIRYTDFENTPQDKIQSAEKISH